MDDLGHDARRPWRRAAACSGGNCPEVAVTDAHVLLRDSKAAGSPSLSFTHDEWRTFVGAVRAGEFDLP